MARISRPCYDKYHRCPGWAGGGWKFAKHYRCSNGSIAVNYEAPLWRWRFHRCNTCGLIVLPYRVRWIDPSNWIVQVQTAIRQLRH
jgi:hypothetical protein